MPFVMDASGSACWLLPDEAHPVATAARARLAGDHAVVPQIWWFEIRNLLVVNDRRGRLDPERSDRALGILRRLPIEFDQRQDEGAILGNARAYRLTIYDAAHLELARRKNLPLATLDAQLARAGRAEQIALIGEAQ